MASLPVPGEGWRDTALNFAVMSDGRILYHYPESNLFLKLALADYEQYRAAYPDGPTMDTRFLAENDHESDQKGDDSLDDTVSEASSASIFCPCMDAKNIEEPFVRPPNPELGIYDVNFDFSQNEGGGEEPNPVLVSTPSYGFNHLAMTSSNNSPSNLFPKGSTLDVLGHCDGLASEYLTCRYHQRATALSWTGLEETSWGDTSYICPHHGTLGLYQTWEAASGVLHGQLSRCTWGGYTNPDRVPPPPAGTPELVLTTAEGEDLWLDDCFVQYEPGSDVFDFRQVEYGHACSEVCIEFFKEFGWNLCPDWQLWQLAHQHEFISKRQMSEEQPEKEQVQTYARRVLEAIPEEEDSNREEPEQVVVKGTTSQIDENEPSDEELAVEGANAAELLGRIARMVEEGSMVLKEIAAESERNRPEEEEKRSKKEEAREEEILSFWDRDPTYVTNMRWSDIMDAEEQKPAVEGQGRDEKRKISFWDQPPTFVSNMRWSDIMDAEGDEY